jgi:hypothetical protein
VIARHSRSYGREEMIFNPLHHLALLEQKTNALDQAEPLGGWRLPEELIEQRRQMEVRLGKHGRREFVQGTNSEESRAAVTACTAGKATTRRSNSRPVLNDRSAAASRVVGVGPS